METLEKGLEHKQFVRVCHVILVTVQSFVSYLILLLSPKY